MNYPPVNYIYILPPYFAYMRREVMCHNSPAKGGYVHLKKISNLKKKFRIFSLKMRIFRLNEGIPQDHTIFDSNIFGKLPNLLYLNFPVKQQWILINIYSGRDYASRREAFGVKINQHPLHVQTLARMEVRCQGPTVRWIRILDRPSEKKRSGSDRKSKINKFAIIFSHENYIFSKKFTFL